MHCTVLKWRKGDYLIDLSISDTYPDLSISDIAREYVKFSNPTWTSKAVSINLRISTKHEFFKMIPFLVRGKTITQNQ